VELEEKKKSSTTVGTKLSNFKAVLKFALETQIPDIQSKIDAACNTSRTGKLISKHKGASSSENSNFIHPIVFGQFTQICEHTFKESRRHKDFIFWHLLVVLLGTIGCRMSSLSEAKTGEVATIIRTNDSETVTKIDCVLNYFKGCWESRWFGS